MMIENVTWGNYFSLLAATFAIYYFFIALIYYRQELFQFINGGKLLPSKLRLPSKGAQAADYNGLEPVVSDIKGILEKAGTGAEKNALLPLLIQRLSSYGGLKHPAFRIAIINYIIRNAESLCSLTFTERELEEALREYTG